MSWQARSERRDGIGRTQKWGPTWGVQNLSRVSNAHRITSSFNHCPRAGECLWLVQGIVTFAAINRAHVPEMPPACPVVPLASRSQPSPPPVTLVTSHGTSPWHLLFDRPAAVAMNVIDHRASRWHLMRYKHVELIFSNDRNDPRGEPVAFVIP
jgi:hypothetical protein